MTKIIVSIISCFTLLINFSCTSNNDAPVKTAVETNSKETVKNAIKQFPDSAILVQNLIELYREDGDYDSALVLTDTQIVKDSGNAYLWNMKATLLFENEDTANAIKSLEHAVNIYPLPEYLVALGIIYAETKNPKSLIIADGLMKANKVKSGKDAMFIKGVYHSYMNDKNQAISYFDSSLHMDFTYMFSYREKAIALYDLGKYVDAIEVLKKAVTIQNNFDEGYYWLGRCYEKLGREDDAIESYQTALLYDKNFTEAKDALAKLKAPEH
jgi:tetratricopeptide (TPR) repeat protein